MKGRDMVQKIKDGRGWSPDGGWFVAKDNVVYWDDGDVSNMNDGGFIRLMPDLNWPYSGIEKTEMKGSDMEDKKIDAVFVNPNLKGNIDIYLKKEAGLVYPCDKDGNKLAHLTSVNVEQNINCITTVTLTAHVCGWIE